MQELLLLLTLFWVSWAPVWGLCPNRCSCPSIYENVCSGVSFSSIPQDFDSNVKTLDLSSNNISRTIFPKSLVILREVNLSHNNITNASFNDLPKLQQITLSFNALSAKSTVDISKLPQINYLNLAGNQLSENLHLESNSLRVLDLSNNQLRDIPYIFSKTLPNLETLIVAQNLIKRIAYLPETLSVLDVSSCQISHLNDKSFIIPSTLYELRASNNSELKLSLSGKCLSIQIADFSRCSLSKISIESLCDVRNINFAHNSISPITAETFSKNTHLKKLNISFNNLEEIHKEAFVNNTKLRILDVSNNLLKESSWTSYLPVHILNLSNNKIQSIKNFRLSQVINLDLSNNMIEEVLSGVSKEFPNIEFLNLRNNRIEIINPLNSQTLKTLNLGYCQIFDLGAKTFANLTKLYFLDLEGNKLKQLDYHTFANIPNITSISLGHNPWNCDCNDQRFQKLFEYLLLNNSFVRSDTLKCNEAGDTWVQVCPPAPLIKPTDSVAKSKHLFAGVGIFILVVFLCVGASIYCKILTRRRLLLRSQENAVVVAPNPVAVHNIRTVRRSQSAADVRSTPPVREIQAAPPSYEEALLLPPLSETERMTRSMDVLLSAGRRSAD